MEAEKQAEDTLSLYLGTTEWRFIMEETGLRVSYHREMKKNYLMIDAGEPENQRFETKMLIGNAIDGLLKFRIRKTDGSSQFCYEITSRQPLKRLLESRTIGAEQIRTLLLGIARTLTGMEEYLLSEEQIILNPDFIYVDPEDFSPGLCLIPGKHGDFPKEFSNLLQELLDKVDHQDKEAVIMIYGLYRESLKENYGLDNLLRWLVKEDCPNMDNNQKEEESEIIEEKPQISEMPRKEEQRRNPDFPLKEVIFLGMLVPGICVVLWFLKGPEVIYGWYNQERWITKGILIAAGGGLVSITGIMLFIWRWKKALRQAAAAEEPMPSFLPCKDSLNPKPDSSHEASFRNLNYENSGSNNQAASPWQMVFSEEETEEVIPADEDDSHTVLLWRKESDNTRRLVCEDGTIEPIAIGYFPFLIGKQENLTDYTLSRDTVSRVHVRIDQTDAGYLLTDLNSTNGTSVNGRKLENNETITLNIGDQVEIADISFSFR